MGRVRRLGIRIRVVEIYGVIVFPFPFPFFWGGYPDPALCCLV